MELDENMYELDKKVIQIVKDNISLYGQYLTMEVVNEYSIRLNFTQREGTPKDFILGMKALIYNMKKLGVIVDSAIRIAEQEDEDVGRYGFLVLVFNPPFQNAHFLVHSVS